ncbi:MAG: hypothetical protein IPK19_24510 [Chloroflexi bacterium]|nr:hypothetical protein [Chloroflexota bacterium]
MPGVRTTRTGGIPDKTGVLWGRQHHTLDMELFGANAWLTGFYLAALKAGAEMAEFPGEHEFSTELLTVFARGKTWADQNLFDGESTEGRSSTSMIWTCWKSFDREGDSATDLYWSEEQVNSNIRSAKAATSIR